MNEALHIEHLLGAADPLGPAAPAGDHRPAAKKPASRGGKRGASDLKELREVGLGRKGTTRK